MQLQAITKKFSDFTALDNVSMEFEAGKAYVLTGPNGAGKTTLLRIIAGLIKPTSGTVSIGGLSVGIMLEESYLYLGLTARENLVLYASLFGVPKTRVDVIIGSFDLSSFIDNEVSVLSHGQKQRVSFARAMLNAPQILLLDEPFDGLDIQSTTRLQGFLAEFKKKGGISIVSTHNLEQLAGNADLLTMLDKGRVKYFGEFRI